MIPLEYSKDFYSYDRPCALVGHKLVGQAFGAVVGEDGVKSVEADFRPYFCFIILCSLILLYFC